jgi:acyl-CoA synthetase (AMP-forming)/AMP-acid ligase II
MNAPRPPPPTPPLLQVAILDEQCNLLPPGQIGEVCIQGPNVTKGYVDNPTANEEAFAGGAPGSLRSMLAEYGARRFGLPACRTTHPPTHPCPAHPRTRVCTHSPLLAAGSTRAIRGTSTCP